MEEQMLTAESDAPEKAASGSREAAGAPLPSRDPEIEAELARIRAMDPEMTDLGAIIRSDAGEKFQEYVNRGLNFLDAYTLAARERLGELRDRRTAERARMKAVGKGHLSATSTRGQGSVNVPAGELAVIRALLPEATDEEIRRYYQYDRKRFKR